MTDQLDLAKWDTVDPAAIAAAETAKARIQAAYIMALRKPRSIDAARAAIMTACENPAFAKVVEFAKPIGDRKVRGPSIRFAELALRAWTNIDSDIQVLYEDQTTRRIKVRVLDLESNTSFSKEIQLAKTVERKSSAGRVIISERLNSSKEKVYVVEATEDEILNKENALISKALRNEGLRLIPGGIIEEALEKARKTRANEAAADPDKAKNQIVDAFRGLRIMPKDLEKYLRHPLDILTPSEIEDLRTIWASIRDGESTWYDYVPAQTDGPKEPAKYDIHSAAPAGQTPEPEANEVPRASNDQILLEEIRRAKPRADSPSAENYRSLILGKISVLKELPEIARNNAKAKWDGANLGPWPLDPQPVAKEPEVVVSERSTVDFVDCPREMSGVGVTECQQCKESGQCQPYQEYVYEHSDGMK